MEEKKMNELSPLVRRVMEALDKQSVNYELDDDGDLLFDLHYLHFVFGSDTEDPTYARLMLYHVYEIKDTDNLLVVYRAASEVTNVYKFAKVNVAGRNVHISIESIMDEGTDVDATIQRFIGLMEEAFVEFRRMLIAFSTCEKDIPNNQE